MVHTDKHLVHVVFAGGVVLFFCQAILTHFHHKVKRRNVSTTGESDDELILHLGSCFCRRVTFNVKAPKILLKMDTPSKTNFSRLNVPWYSFELLSGESAMSLYTNQNKSDSSSHPSVGAEYGTDVETEVFAFCSFCGVHILYSPSLEPEKVQVNVDCISRLDIPYDAVPVKSMSHHNRRGMGTVCGQPVALIAFRSMLFENQTNAFEYAGLPYVADEGSKSINQARTNSEHRTCGFSRNNRNSDILFGGRDIEFDVNISSGLLKKELGWTEILSQFDSDSNIFKSGPTSPKIISGRASSQTELYDSPDIEECSLHSFSSCISKVRTPSTDSGMYTDAQSDIDTNSNDNDNDFDDSLSVLSSLLTGEDPAPFSSSTAPYRSRGQGQEVGPTQSHAISSSNLLYWGNINAQPSYDNKGAMTEKTLPEYSTGSLNQMRRHLSQYLKKPQGDHSPVGTAKSKT